ncbi:SDR family NAD(P)-dependent oxidoreductase [Propylenella binzhouense]|uniref:SDR family oxidoreductase n=1 Tax=Propylenella binzhouense TaxID=2555902 RepID=A0A964T1Y3_9HYPH|nr:SDR family NAD(P)-dependent oxidoreductase [Propylenella binzhouense]MYZ46906.1 SDR family oxidoreductase [Propylenella binzhouense]
MAGVTRRTAIITGAGAGIGRAIAQTLSRAGYDIGIFDLDRSGAEETAALVRREGRLVEAAYGNVASRQEVEAGAAQLIEALGHVDLLVNNAGILRTSRFLETSEEEWRKVFSVNLDGAFNFCQTVLPHMVKRQSGVVVNMASWTGKKGVPNHAAYSASKFAIIGLTQVLAGEMAEHGIRVNAVCPGIIVDTRMREEAEALNRAQGLPDVETRVKTIPLRRAGQPDDIAGVVAFLASDAAAYMTGQAINVTGGLWMN